MRFIPTSIAGAYVVEQERHTDERGFFARTWCAREFEERGLDAGIAQCSVSFNRQRGTLRGLHYQAPPFTEVKLVRCTRGALYDVVLDLRPDSATFRAWLGVELGEADGRGLYVPRGCAHGFYVLADETEVAYQISDPYRPQAARGVRWDDRFHGVAWPGPVTVISARDRDLPDVTAADLEELRGLGGRRQEQEARS
jgi:dTDP-4-dehydrorhamnose 3,5-epimerase